MASSIPQTLWQVAAMSGAFGTWVYQGYTDGYRKAEDLLQRYLPATAQTPRTLERVAVASSASPANGPLLSQFVHGAARHGMGIAGVAVRVAIIATALSFGSLMLSAALQGGGLALQATLLYGGLLWLRAA